MQETSNNKTGSMSKGVLLAGLSTLMILGSGLGCSKGLNTTDVGSLTSGGSNNNLDNGRDGATPDTPRGHNWDDVQRKVDGAVDGWKYNGQVVIQIDSVNQAIVLVMPLPPIFLMPVTTMAIPELPGAALFPLTQPDGTTAMAVRIPLKYLIKGASLSNYNSLPNGDPLPFMPVGENRGFAISFPQNPRYRLHTYISANAAAVFIETPDFNLPEQWIILPSLGFPVKNQDKTKIVGYFAVVANRGVHSSGVYVAGRLPNEVAILIDELLRY